MLLASRREQGDGCTLPLWFSDAGEVLLLAQREGAALLGEGLSSRESSVL